MCLAIPGKVAEIYQADGLRMGRIDYSGLCREACLEYTPEAVPGCYVIVHAGYALEVLDEDKARETLALFNEAELKAAAAGEDLYGKPLPTSDRSRKP